MELNFLTQNPIADVIASGSVENTSFADEFIKRVENETGVKIVACYGSADGSWKFERVSKPFRRGVISGIRLEKLIRISAYVDLRESDLRPKRDELQPLTARIFEECMSKYGIEPVYSEAVVPQELKSIDLSAYKAEKRVEVKLESLSGLAVWHYIDGSLKALNCLTEGLDIGASYCGWDERQQSMTVYVITTEDKLKNGGFDEITGRMFEIIKRRDLLGVLNTRDFQPVFTTRDKISDEKMFELLRN